MASLVTLTHLETPFSMLNLWVARKDSNTLAVNAYLDLAMLCSPLHAVCWRSLCGAEGSSAWCPHGRGGLYQGAGSLQGPHIQVYQFLHGGRWAGLWECCCRLVQQHCEVVYEVGAVFDDV